jgi:hypothetical protein
MAKQSTAADSTKETEAPLEAPVVVEIPQDEPRNVAVSILENATKIGNAIVASGPCDFPLTMTDAKALEALGKVKITGIF